MDNITEKRIGYFTCGKNELERIEEGLQNRNIGFDSIVRIIDCGTFLKIAYLYDIGNTNMDNTMTLDFNSKSNEDLPLSITMNGIEYFSSKLFDSSQNLSKINLELSKVGLELCRNEISEPSSPDKYESIINDALKYGDGYTAYQDGYFAGKKKGYEVCKDEEFKRGYVEGYNACIDCFNINYEHKIDDNDVSDM